MNDNAQAKRELPAEALKAYRAALAAEDWPAIEARTDFEHGSAAALGSHPLLRAAGAASAAGFLTRIAQSGRESMRQQLPALGQAWRETTSDPYFVRWIDRDEAEVYERCQRGSERFEMATHVRFVSGTWRVLASDPALPDRAEVRVVSGRAGGSSLFDAPAFAADYDACWGETATLSCPSDDRIEIHTRDGKIDGVFLPTADADHDSRSQAEAPGAAPAGILELSCPLPDDVDERLNRLAGFTCAARVVVRRVGTALLLHAGPPLGRALPSADVERLSEAAAKELSGLSELWVGLYLAGGFLVTQGMRYFMLPELEMRAAEPAPTPSATALMRDLIAYLVDNGPILKPGHSIGPPGAPNAVVRPGRRGPTSGDSYGRWGSLTIEPTARGSASGG